IGPCDFSHRTLTKTGECVIALPGVDLAETVVDLGNCSGDTVAPFELFSFRTRPSKDVAAPLLAAWLATTAHRLANPAPV
ncbi:flavin reductase family protein, partial [Rhizobium ruizarguesonis]